VWSQLPVADVAASSWYPGPVATLVPAAQGFSWALAGTSVVQYRDRPFPLPAVAARSVTPRTGPFTATGLDGTDLPVDVVATPASTPGAPGAGVIVDRQYAHLAAQGYVAPTDSQVWIAGDPGPVESALRREGVAISSVSTIAATAATYGRSGPGLADSLFLAEAGAAAVLASGTVVAALYLLARRRRYELAALVSVGVSRRRLATSVLIEQLSLVAYGAAVGVGAGLASAAVLLVDIPEFDTTPAGVVLARFPSAYPLAAILAGAFLLVAAAAAVAAVRLVSGTELTQLREVPG
jgi:hypothetical protein